MVWFVPSHYSQLYIAIVGVTVIVGVSLVTSELTVHAFCLSFTTWTSSCTQHALKLPVMHSLLSCRCMWSSDIAIWTHSRCCTCECALCTATLLLFPIWYLRICMYVYVLRLHGLAQSIDCATQFRNSYISIPPFHFPVLQTVPQTLPQPTTS